MAASILPQIPIVDGRPVIRRSLWEALRQCAWFEREDNERLAFGSAFHDFAAMYWLLCLETRRDNLLTRVSRLAEQAWARQPGVLAARWPEFLLLCEQFAEAHPAELGSLMHIEQTLTLDVGWAILTGTFDRADRADDGDPDDAPVRVRLTDYKSELGEMDHSFQVWVYAKIAFERWPSVAEIEFLIDPVRQIRPYPPVIITRGQLDRWWDMELAVLKERVFGARGERHGGPACEGCRLRYTCASAVAEAVLAPTNDDEARALAENRERLAAGLATADHALEAYTADRGEPLRDVAGRDIGWMTTLKPSVRVIAPVTTVLDWARDTNRDPDEVVKPVTPTRRDDIHEMVDAGLAVEEFKPRRFTVRKHKPLRDDRIAGMA